MQASELSVLMISQDPSLLKSTDEDGDVLNRHRRYAQTVGSLSIIVIGGDLGKEVVVDEHLRLYPAGVGIAGFLHARNEAVRVARSNRCNLVISQNPHLAGLIALHLKKKLGIPLLVHLHGDFLDNQHWLNERVRHRLYALIQSRVLRAADGVRAASSGIAEKLVKMGIKEERLRTIHTPVNDTAFVRLDEKRSLRLEELRYKYADRKIIVFAGRLDPSKNLLFALDAVREVSALHPDVLFFIIGGGAMEARLKERADALGISTMVRFLGAQPQRELALYFRLALVNLLLSTNESFGKVIIEAGLCGTTTLASDTTGARQIMEEGTTGFLVPVNDRASTVSILHEMLLYPSDTRSFGERARTVYQSRYSAEASFKTVTDYWLTVALS